ncbi:Cysteine--tRNA ligase [bioreactor metagenome]|uniref:Cysteine--tRNA ligase n=1 Tax=bioreactor metagenome TaxID=1076179 RepID=A0A645D4W2_9ZZZZ
MDDDFNTADAITAVYELVKFINVKVKEGFSKKTAVASQKMLMELCAILGILQDNAETEEDFEKEKIEALIEKRTEAKKAKDFAAADAIRDELAAMGITIKDTRQGVQWFRG